MYFAFICEQGLVVDLLPLYNIWLIVEDLKLCSSLLLRKLLPAARNRACCYRMYTIHGSSLSALIITEELPALHGCARRGAREAARPPALSLLRVSKGERRDNLAGNFPSAAVGETGSQPLGGWRGLSSVALEPSGGWRKTRGAKSEGLFPSAL